MIDEETEFAFFNKALKEKNNLKDTIVFVFVVREHMREYKFKKKKIYVEAFIKAI